MPKRILLVDDEEDLTVLLEFNLRRAGYDVSVAHTGEHGLAAALANPPDLVVLDVMLPDLDGFGICELLRHEAAGSRLPILFLTACASEDARKIGAGLGADEYIIKPFSPSDVVERVRRLLGERCAPPDPSTH